MTHAISLPTPFTDISELAESFASRIDEERLMLPHHEPVAEGEWVQFAVTLADGSGALVGVGRCTGSYDNGEDRAPEHRFDIVMDSLDLDEMGQIYFERILQVRAAQMGAEPQTGEVNVDEAEQALAAEEAVAAAEEYAPAYGEAPAADEAPAYEAPAYEAAPAYEEPPAYDAAPAYEEPLADAPAYAEPAGEAAPPYEAPAAYDAPPAYDEAPYGQPDASAYEAPADAPLYEEPAADGWDDPGHTQIGDAGKLLAEARGERLAAPVHAIYELPPPTAPGQLPSPHANGAVLTRRFVTATWSPEPAPRPDPSPSSGLFQYGDGGLPQPAQPPRPAIDPSLRVMRAPRPGDPHSVAMMRSAAAAGGAAAVAYAEEAYEAPADEGYAEMADELSTQEGAAMDAEYPTFDADEADFGELPDSGYDTGGDETAQVELPDDDEQ